MIIAVFIATMLIGIGIGLPIAMALLLCAVCTALAMGGGDANPTIIARTLMQGSDSVTMMALPFFVLAGEIMNRGGLTKRIIAFCDVFLGRIRGGLGYVTIFACLMFAALVGSAVAACAALGAILIPMMVRSGYNREESSALVASANLVAPIMPPSVPMIVYGVSAGVSIKSMFMAGIAPAVYLTIIACVVWFLRTRKEGVVPSVEDFKAPTPKEAVRIFLGGLWALLLPVIILVGLHSGKFTATEAGVIACVYAILVGLLVYREMKLKDLGPVFVSAAKTSAVVMFLAAAANVAAYYMTVSRIPQPGGSGGQPHSPDDRADAHRGGGRPGHGRHPQHPDPYPHHAAPGQGRRHQPRLLRRVLRADERAGPDLSPGGSRAERGLRRRQREDGQDHSAHHALLPDPDGPVLPAGYFPAAGRGASEVVRRLIGRFFLSNSHVSRCAASPSGMCRPGWT